MKKLLIGLLLFSTFVNAQEKTKKIEIYKSGEGNYVDAIQTIVDNNITDTRLTFTGRDHQYQQIDSYILFFGGNAKDFFTLLEKLKKSFDEELDITITINDLTVTTTKLMGKKVIMLRANGKSGYRYFNLKTIEKIKDKTEIWCKENNIIYN